MYPALLFTHSYLRYIVLILLLIVIVKSLIGWLEKKPFEAGDNKRSLFLMVAAHIQLLLGLLLYIFSPVVQFSGEAMKVAATRYWLVEHAFGMIIAIVLITIARSKTKKGGDAVARHKTLFIFNLIALLIIVATILAGDRPFLLFR